MRIKNALVYTVEHGFVERDVRIKNGCFAGSEAAGTDGEEILRRRGRFPGFRGLWTSIFTDVQVMISRTEHRRHCRRSGRVRASHRA